MSAISDAMSKMRANKAIAKDKGTFGEIAVLEVLKSYQRTRGGTLIHSFVYNYASNRQGKNYAGNIHRTESGEFVTLDGTAKTEDEIDILYVTPYRIFCIEAKARGGEWRLEEDWCFQNSKPVDKSPLAQAEKHARHLYHRIYEYLPDGVTNYIVPVTVFVDKATVADARNAESKFYLPATIINTLKEKIKGYDLPLKYCLDEKSILERLKQIGKGQIIK